MKHIPYKKEILISSVAVGAVTFILMNLQSPLQTPISKEKTFKEANRKQEKNQILSEAKRTPSSTKNSITKRRFRTLEEKMNYTFSQIKKIEHCLEEECDYPDNDPREYSLSVYKSLSHKITNYKKFWIKAWHKMSVEQKNRITGLIAHDDGHVKEEVLSLLSSLPTEEASKYVDLVLNEVIDYHDSKLIPTALDLLAKTKSPTTEVTISTRLSSALQQGSPHVSQEISKGIHYFISDQTAAVYEQTLELLPNEAPETTYLTSALSEFEMQQSGG